MSRGFCSLGVHIFDDELDTGDRAGAGLLLGIGFGLDDGDLKPAAFGVLLGLADGYRQIELNQAIVLTLIPQLNIGQTEALLAACLI